MSQIFREADPWHDPKRMHPTFAKKPLVENQAVARVSRMEESSGVKLATVHDQAPKPVPTTWDTTYDPSNPNADWAGNVATRERAHFSGHRSMQSGISQESDGFISKDEQPMWSNKRRGNAAAMASTPGLIGGISCGNTEEQYKSVAHRQAALEGTMEDQFTLAKRSIHAGAGKRPTTNRQQENAAGNSVADADEEEEAAYMAYERAQAKAAYAQGQGQQTAVKESLVGYRAPAQTKSLMTGLAASISLAVSASTGGSTGFVPTKDRKNLDTDNKPIPGYTGYRRGQI